MTDKELLAAATRFEIGSITIESRGGGKWALMSKGGSVLGKDRRFHYEPLPSSRSDNFIKLTRFNSPQEAYEFWLGGDIKLSVLDDAKEVYRGGEDDVIRRGRKYHNTLHNKF